jgi:hypothetical protein
MPQAIFAAYDTLGPDWQTTLLLNNTSRVPLTVNPTVYSLDGAGVPLPVIHLEAHEHQRVDFTQLVAPLGGNYAQGSLRLQYVGAGMGLGAILSSINLQRSLVVEALLHSEMDFKSSDLEAIWWAPDPYARMTLALTNISEHTLNASLTLRGQDGGEIRNQPVPLASHQTRMLNLRELMARDDLLGGISVRYDGAMPGAILAQGFVLQPATGFSYDLPFTDPATLGSAKFSGAGIPLGLMGDGAQPRYNLSGKLLLRNLSVTPMAVTPALQRGSAKTALPQVALLPGESKQVDVSAGSAPVGDGPIGIELPYTGRPGDLLAQWFSLDDSGSLVVEVPLRSLSPTDRATGSNPFLLTGDSTSVTYIKNTGDTVSHVLAYIQHGGGPATPGGQYMIGLKEIQPGETIAIDIRKLRDGQVRDQKGHLLPQDLLTGQINWRLHDGAPIVGRTQVMSLTQALASNRSCPTCDCTPTQIVMNLDPVTLGVGDSFQPNLTETDFGCDGSQQFIGPGYGNLWFTNNTSVATVNNNGNVTGVGPGSTTVTANGSVPYYNFIPDDPFGPPTPHGGICDPATFDFSAPALATVTTPDVVVIAWIDGGGITLPGGANSNLVNRLAGGTASCGDLLLDWATGNATYILTGADQTYANFWLLKHSSNSEPSLFSINPANVLSGGDFRLFVRYQVKFTNSGGTISNLTALQSNAVVGKTPDPCGSGATFDAEALSGANGANGLTSTATGAYKLAEGRIGQTGQAVNLTINLTTTPYVWSVIRFDASGNFSISDRAIFPTYYVYRNGEFLSGWPPSTASISTFISKNNTYLRNPQDIQ